MSTLKKQVRLERKDYYTTHLSIVNPLLPVKLSPKEIEILAIFMSFRGEMLEQNRFGTTAKKIVREKLNLSHAGLANYLRSLREKGFIKKIGSNIVILPILHPSEDSQEYFFKLINIG